MSLWTIPKRYFYHRFNAPWLTGSRRERSDATAQALKGSLNYTLGEGLVFTYMPSAGLKVMGKQKAVAGCSPCVCSCCLHPISLLLSSPLILPPGLPGVVAKGRASPRCQGLHPDPTSRLFLGGDSTPYPSLMCCFSTTLSSPSTKRQPQAQTFSLTQSLLQPRHKRSLLQVPIEGMFAVFDTQQREAHTLSVKPNTSSVFLPPSV